MPQHRRSTDPALMVTEETPVSIKLVLAIVAASFAIGGTAWALSNHESRIAKLEDASMDLRLHEARNEEQHKSILETLERIEKALIPATGKKP